MSSMEESDLRVVDQSPLHYLLSVPTASASEVESRPVLCFLHGYDEAAPMEIRRALTRHGPLRQGNPSEVADRFIVVAPQLSPPGGDVWHRHADTVQQIVTEVREGYGGDPRRTYLTGFSFGGNGVFDLALAQPGFWAALWAVDPTRVPTRDPRRPAWLSFGEVSRRRKKAFIRALDLEPAREATSGDRLHLDQDQDHAGSARLAYKDDQIYRWLLSKELPASA